MFHLKRRTVYRALLCCLLVQECLPSHQSRPSPMFAMSDLTNDFGVCALQLLAQSMPGQNIAFSPYGLASVSMLLYEGSGGNSALQLGAALQLPPDVVYARVGFRDLYRHLRTYFMSDGFLKGLMLSREDICIRSDYSKVLAFYGFDLPDHSSVEPCIPGGTSSRPTIITPRPTTTQRPFTSAGSTSAPYTASTSAGGSTGASYTASTGAGGSTSDTYTASVPVSTTASVENKETSGLTESLMKETTPATTTTTSTSSGLIDTRTTLANQNTESSVFGQLTSITTEPSVGTAEPPTQASVEMNEDITTIGTQGGAANGEAPDSLNGGELPMTTIGTYSQDPSTTNLPITTANIPETSNEQTTTRLPLTNMPTQSASNEQTTTGSPQTNVPTEGSNVETTTTIDKEMLTTLSNKIGSPTDGNTNVENDSGSNMNGNSESVTTPATSVNSADMTTTSEDNGSNSGSSSSDETTPVNNVVEGVTTPITTGNSEETSVAVGDNMDATTPNINKLERVTNMNNVEGTTNTPVAGTGQENDGTTEAAPVDITVITDLPTTNKVQETTVSDGGVPQVTTELTNANNAEQTTIGGMSETVATTPVNKNEKLSTIVEVTALPPSTFNPQVEDEQDVPTANPQEEQGMPTTESPNENINGNNENTSNDNASSADPTSTSNAAATTTPPSTMVRFPLSQNI
uniref:Serpin domain-containing protein n=1 Tax=Cacopsylla melanoneura TaxID=428564 RepID=A0A8D8QRH9_9HEMI